MSNYERRAALVSSNGFPTIKIDTGMLLVGRSPECDVIVESKKISRRHCCLALGRNHLHVRDLGSTNGCWRQGERLDDFSVAEGQEFSIGDASYRFQWDHPSDHVMLPSAKRKESSSRAHGPHTYPDSTANRASPESSDPMMHLAGLA
jgi:pSer/pThr/pTyr-binding forkhead associated (FHA) protein